MAWFKVDETFWCHPKVLGICQRHRCAAVGLWVTAGTWSVGQKTYGSIPDLMVRPLGGTPRLAGRLVSAGLWSRHSTGYQFHQWRRWQDGDYRPNIRQGVRLAVMERDNYRCVFCGTTDQLSLDHIIRYSDNGPDTAENLRVLCMPCNLERELAR